MDVKKESRTIGMRKKKGVEKRKGKNNEKGKEREMKGCVREGYNKRRIGKEGRMIKCQNNVVVEEAITF